jgi:hypothetical protein
MQHVESEQKGNMEEETTLKSCKPFQGLGEEVRDLVQPREDNETITVGVDNSGVAELVIGIDNVLIPETIGEQNEL